MTKPDFSLQFSGAKQEVRDCLSRGDCEFAAVKTVFTDLNIGKHELKWTTPDANGQNQTHDLGYVHRVA